MDQSNQHRNLAARMLLAVVVMVALLAAGGSPAFAAPSATYTLTGKITLLDGSTAVTDATVIAIQAGQPKQTGDTNGAGDYFITLPVGGDWNINILPHETVATTSPAWVYTGGVVIDTIVADPGNTALNLMVTTATAQVTGTLLVPAPDAPATFTGGNAASVRVADQEGQGNTVQVASDGTFTVNVLPGDIEVHVGLKNVLWAPDPTLAGSVWTIPSGTFPIPTTAPNPLQLLKKQASITGTVLDDLGHAAKGIPVRAWRLDASEADTTVSSLTDGSYTLNVLNGIWEIWAVPDPSQPYVSADSPQTVVIISPTGSKVQDLNIITADVTVTGTVVDSHNVPISPAPNGRVIPTYLDKDGVHWRQFTNGTPITGGTYTLKLSSSLSSHYRLHTAFPNLQGYTEITAPSLDLVKGQTTYTDVNLPIAADNSTISGHLVDQSAAVKTGLAGAVYGASDGGAFAVRRVNPVDGSYSFNVAASNLNGNGGTFWWLHAFVDPTSTFVVARPRVQKVFLPYNINGTGTNATGIDFTVVKLDATIKGTVTDPSSVPVPFAKVMVNQQVATPGTGFNRWVLTGIDGKYSVTVPAGTYKVRADHFKWISPVPQIVTVASLGTVTQDLQFRAFDATISGKVTYLGLPHPAMVRAWTSDGAHTWIPAVQNLAGNYIYVLRVNSGDTWHIQAVGEDGSDFLKSTVSVITTVAGPNKGNDLDLQKVSSLPGAVVFSFDPTVAQVLTLSDGSEVDIPANAMATSGTVTVIVRPLPELANDGVTSPVSFGYRLLAYDELGTPIDHFNAAVTLVMPYTAAQLTDLGVTPADLIPSYWDLGTNSFKPVDNYTVTQNSDGSGSLNLQVMHFTDYAVMYDTTPAFISFNAYLPTISH